MTFSPTEHHRRSTRLPTYDYSWPGGYFMTVCAHSRKSIFGKVVDGNMRPNWLGQIVSDCWSDIPLHFPDVELDAFVVMPNHLHGIVLVGLNRPPGRREPGAATDGRGAACCAPTGTTTSWPFAGPCAGALGAIVRSFKSAVTRRVNAVRRSPGRAVWQRNYYEHVIRNPDDLAEIRQYIADNPLKWESDKENLAWTGGSSGRGVACYAPTFTSIGRHACQTLWR